MFKQIMIPVAAFAVTAAGVSAFNPDVLEKIDVDLTDSQVAALETAHDMKDAGSDRAEVQAYLEENGIDQELKKEIRTAAREVRHETRAAVKAAVETGNYSVFVAAAPDKLTDAIASEADFTKFVEAHELKEAGDREGAQEIMSGLGLEKPEGRGHKDGEREGGKEGRGFGGPGSHKGDKQSAE